MDWVANIVTSGNFGLVAVFITVLLSALALMAKSGVFSVNKGGIKIGKTENELRAMLMRMNDYAEEFCNSECISLVSTMKNKGFEMGLQNAQFVFMRVLNEVLSWILVNHISTDDFYMICRIRDVKNIVSRAIGEINQELRCNEKYMTEIYSYCEDFTRRLLHDLEQVRDSEKR